MHAYVGFTCVSLYPRTCLFLFVYFHILFFLLELFSVTLLDDIILIFIIYWLVTLIWSLSVDFPRWGILCVSHVWVVFFMEHDTFCDKCYTLSVELSRWASCLFQKFKVDNMGEFIVNHHVCGLYNPYDQIGISLLNLKWNTYYITFLSKRVLRSSVLKTVQSSEHSFKKICPLSSYRKSHCFFIAEKCKMPNGLKWF